MGVLDWMDEITERHFLMCITYQFREDSEKSLGSIYRDIEGIVPKTGYNQIGGRLNLTQKLLNDRLNRLKPCITNKNAKIGFDDVFDLRCDAQRHRCMEKMKNMIYMAGIFKIST